MMEEMVLHHNVPGLIKGEKYKIGTTHYDVNGKWDGLATWMVHFTDSEGEKVMIVYVSIGDYWQVGLWPTDEGKHSRWETVRYIAGLMQDGISPDLIFDAVQMAVGGIE